MDLEELYSMQEDYIKSLQSEEITNETKFIYYYININGYLRQGGWLWSSDLNKLIHVYKEYLLNYYIDHIIPDFYYDGINGYLEPTKRIRYIKRYLLDESKIAAINELSKIVNRKIKGYRELQLFINDTISLLKEAGMDVSTNIYDDFDEVFNIISSRSMGQILNNNMDYLINDSFKEPQYVDIIPNNGRI